MMINEDTPYKDLGRLEEVAARKLCLARRLDPDEVLAGIPRWQDAIHEIRSHLLVTWAIQEARFDISDDPLK